MLPDQTQGTETKTPHYQHPYLTATYPPNSNLPRLTATSPTRKLYDKKVLVSIDDVHQSTFRAVTIEFSSTDEVGVFEVSGKLGGLNLEKINLVFEDLLQVTVISVFYFIQKYYVYLSALIPVIPSMLKTLRHSDTQTVPRPGPFSYLRLILQFFQLQYEGVSTLKIEDKVTVNVNLLIYLLNKKFYGQE